MSKFDFRILLESIEGRKTSYITQSFVDTSNELVLSASQVFNRIESAVSCSYQASPIFSQSIVLSDSDVNKNFTFKDNTLLSASLSGSGEFGFVKFVSKNDTYDRLKRYMFLGEKVCTTLGLPNEQWIYVDQLRLPTDNEKNYFQGNVNADTLFINDRVSFSPTSFVSSHITFAEDTSSDRYIRFLDPRPDTQGIARVGLKIGYDVDRDKYEIASEGANFNTKTTGFLLGGVSEITGAGGSSRTININTADVNFTSPVGTFTHGYSANNLER